MAFLFAGTVFIATLVFVTVSLGTTASVDLKTVALMISLGTSVFVAVLAVDTVALDPLALVGVVTLTVSVNNFDDDFAAVGTAVVLLNVFLVAFVSLVAVVIGFSDLSVAAFDNIATAFF